MCRLTLPSPLLLLPSLSHPGPLYSSHLLDVTVKSDGSALLCGASGDLGDEGDVAASLLLKCDVLKDELVVWRDESPVC